MRLTSEQIQDLHVSLRKFFIETPYQLFLYGSRLHNGQKGGDIDLLVVTSMMGKNKFNDFELALLVDMKKHKTIGQRRIDIKACTQDDLLSDPFLQNISDQMIQI